MQLNESIGRIMEQRRKRIEMSQAELSQKSGYGESTIRYTVAGEHDIPVRRMRDMCGVLGLDPVEVLTRAIKEAGS